MPIFFFKARMCCAAIPFRWIDSKRPKPTGKKTRFPIKEFTLFDDESSRSRLSDE